MTIAAAESFVQIALSDTIPIQKINAAPDKTGVKQIFEELGLSFDCEEFELAYLNVLACCQTREQAEAVEEIKLWWDCVQYTLAISESDNP